MKDILYRCKGKGNVRNENKKYLTVDDLAKIKVGQHFTSKKELYELLGLECSAGNTRKAADKTIAQYLKIEAKKKTDVVIAEIYDTLKPRQDKRNERKCDLFNEFDSLLYHYLQSLKNNIVTKNQIAFNLGCFSAEMYDLLISDDLYVAQKLKIPLYAFSLFKQKLNMLCNEKVIARLRKLAQTGEIQFHDVILCDKKGYRDHTEEYIKYFKIRDKLVKQLNFKTYSEAVFLYKNRVKFQKEFNVLLKDNGLEGAYPAFYIRSNTFKPNCLTENISVIQKEMNEFFCDKLQKRIFSAIKNTNKKYQKEWCEKYDQILKSSELINIPMKNAFEYPEICINDINKLLNISLISANKRYKEEIEMFYTPKITSLKDR